MSDVGLRGGNLVSFAPDVDQGLRNDILDCLLHAQLVAEERHDRRRDWRVWIEGYQREIYRTDARITGAIEGRRLQIRNIRELKRLPPSALGTASSPELHALMSKSFAALIESDHAKRFFESWFSFGRSESFQVVPCITHPAGGASILVCGMQMTSRTSIYPGVVLPIWDSVLTIESNGASFHFTREGYAPHRERIRRYLQAVGEQAIIEL